MQVGWTPVSRRRAVADEDSKDAVMENSVLTVLDGEGDQEEEWTGIDPKGEIEMTASDKGKESNLEESEDNGSWMMIF